MALTEFVRNVEDVSDDGGYKFRFHCDRCKDGVESQYVTSAAGLLKTGLEVFSMFRWLGGHTRSAVDGIDRGLRGKERDQAYERAVNEAKVHFSKCSHCGQWVCSHCFNKSVGLCEGCAPDAHEAAARQAAELAAARSVDNVRKAPEPVVAQVLCPACASPTGGGKFCQNCGQAVGQTKACSGCNKPLAAGAKFCGDCGKPA
jgi:hypothetical protein